MFPLSKSSIRIFAAFITTVYAVSAGPVTQVKNFACETSNYSCPLTFNKFSSSETLASIAINVSIQINGGELFIDNDNESSVSGTFQFGVLANINSDDVNLPSPNTAKAFYSRSFLLAGNVNDGIGDYDYSPPDGMYFIGNSSSGSISASAQNTFFNNFIGTGSFDIDVSIMPLVDFGLLENIEYFTSSIQTTGCVEIIYTAVPEPVSIVLLALGCVFFRRHS